MRLALQKGAPPAMMMVTLGAQYILGLAGGLDGGCEEDEVDTPCGMVMSELSGNGVAQCPNNNCVEVNANNQLTYFAATTNGTANYYTYFGPGSMYYSASQAGTAAGDFGFSISQNGEEGGTIKIDSNGLFTYTWTASGPPCGPGVDCEITIAADSDSGDVAVWHTHPVSQDIIQFLGDRTADLPFPDYITTSIGGDLGTFLVGPWGGGVRGQYPPAPEELDYPQIVPICHVSGATFSGISSCN